MRFAPRSLRVEVAAIGAIQVPESDASVKRRRRVVYALLFLLTAVSYVDRTTLSIAAPAIAADFHASSIEMGYLFSSFLWTYVLCLIPAGLLVDRLGSGAVAAGGITLWSLAAAATGISGTFSVMLLTRLALGVGESTAYPAGVHLIRNVAPASERGLATSYLNGGSYAGPAVGAVMIGWLVGAVGWRLSCVITGAMGLLWLVPWMRWQRVQHSASVASGGTAAVTYAQAEDIGSVHVGSRGLAALLRRRSTWGMFITQGTAVYAQYLFLTWLPSYLQQTRALSVGAAGLYMGIAYGASVLLAIGACHLSDRLISAEAAARGRRRLMVAAMMLCSSVLVLTPAVHSTALMALLVAVSLTGISSAISLNFALASDLLGTADDVGKAASVLAVGGNLFGILAPIATGYVIAATGSYNWAFVIAGALVVFGAAASLLMTPSNR